MYWITAIFYSVLFCSNITNPCNTHAHLNLFCQLVTLQTVCWQLVADTPDWRSTYWTGLQSCRCLCVCVCVWLIRLCVGFYKRKMDWLKKKKEKEMYVWARKRENDMLMSAYCMNKRAGNVCMYVWNANVSALSVFFFVCAHELTDDDIQYSTAAHVIIGPALHTFALIKQLPICIHSNLNFASLGLTKQWRAVKTKKAQLS